MYEFGKPFVQGENKFEQDLPIVWSFAHEKRKILYVTWDFNVWGICQRTMG